MGRFGADNGFLTGLTLVDLQIRKDDVGSESLKHFLWTVPSRPLPRQEKTFLPVMRYCFPSVLIFGDSHSRPHNSQDILPRAPVLSKNSQQAPLTLQTRHSLPAGTQGPGVAEPRRRKISGLMPSPRPLAPLPGSIFSVRSGAR